MLSRITAVIFSILVLLAPVQAVVLSPASGSKAAGAEENIRVLATPFTATDTVARLNLHLTNATVLDFTTTFDAFGTCYPSGATDNSTDVCVDLTQLDGSYIQNGEELGVIRVRWGSPGTATIVRMAGTGYYNGSVFNEQLDVAGAYVIGDIPPTALELDNRTIISILGIALVFIGIGLRVYIKDNYNENKSS